MSTDAPEPSKSFTEALQEITGDSWLDDLARQSLVAAEAKFDPPVPPEEEEP